MLNNKQGFSNILVLTFIVLIIIGGLGIFYALNSNKIPSPIRQLPKTFLGKQVNFETVSKEESYNVSGHNAKKDYVIKDVSQWRNLWSNIYSARTPQPDLPNINFDNEMIIAVFQGGQSSGGYSIKITKIIENNNSLEVFVKETSKAPGDMATQSFTNPSHVVKTRRVDKEVLFRH